MPTPPAGGVTFPWLDRFDRADGALGTHDGLTWDGTAWTISTNTAVNTPVLGGELVTNGNMETGDPPSNWANYAAGTRSQQHDERTGGSGAHCIQHATAGVQNYGGIKQTLTRTANEHFFQYDGWMRNVDATWVDLFLTADTYAGVNWTQRTYQRLPQTAATFEITHRSAVNGLPAGTAGRWDDISVKPILYSSTMALVDTGNAQCNAHCDATVAAEGAAGVVLNCNAGKTSFVIGFLSSSVGVTKACLMKVVNGTASLLINTAVTYYAGARIRVERRDATTYRLYYERDQVGADQTINDVEIVGNTLFGMFSTAAGNSISLVQIDDLPDPDFVVLYSSDNHGAFSLTGYWSLARLAARNVALYLDGGDAQPNVGEDGWITRLQTAAVPFNFAPGNHDYDNDPPMGDRTCLLRQTHLGDGVVTGTTYKDAGHAENSYRILNAGGQNWLIVILEAAPLQATVDWLNILLAANPTTPAIILTHALLYPDGTWEDAGDAGEIAQAIGDGHTGQEMWDECLKLHANVILTLNGHFPLPMPGHMTLQFTGNGGNIVNAMVWSKHVTPATGFSRILNFYISRRKVWVETVASHYFTASDGVGSDNEFWFTY